MASRPSIGTRVVWRRSEVVEGAAAGFQHNVESESYRHTGMCSNSARGHKSDKVQYGYPVATLYIYNVSGPGCQTYMERLPLGLGFNVAHRRVG